MEVYHQFILADEFKIKPWEANLDGEKYPEDLSNLIALKTLQAKALQHQQLQSQGNRRIAGVH